MIDKMLVAGLDLRRPSDNVLVDLITGETRTLEGTRMCRFLPAVAKSERGEYLGCLDAFMSLGEMNYSRYGVITAGSPIVAMDSHARLFLQNFHRKLSRWASIAGSRFGVEVIVRCTESTRKMLHERGLDGRNASYHFHANVIYRPKGYSPLLFKTFLSWTRRFFGTHWKDAGVVQDVREIVKYMIKPTDLADAPGEELVWLYQSTQKLKLIQALGPFALYRRMLKSAGLKPKSISGTDEREIVLVKRDTRAPSRNGATRAGLEKTEHDLIARLEREETDEAAQEWLQRLRACQAELAELNAPCPKPPNMIIAVLPPACRFVHFATPAVLVSGFTSVSELADDPKFALLREQAYAYWAANKAPLLKEVQDELRAAQVEMATEIRKNSKKRKKHGRAVRSERRRVAGPRQNGRHQKRGLVSALSASRAAVSSSA